MNYNIGVLPFTRRFKSIAAAVAQLTELDIKVGHRTSHIDVVVIISSLINLEELQTLNAWPKRFVLDEKHFWEPST